MADDASASAPLPVKVRIAYCSDCGYDIQALDLAGALLRRFGDELSSVEIIPWFEGSFEVSIGGNLVHSMFRDGGFPANDAIIAAVSERLGRKPGGA